MSKARPNNSFKPSPLRGLGAGAMIEPSPGPLAGRLNSGVRPQKKDFCAKSKSEKKRLGVLARD